MADNRCNHCGGKLLCDPWDSEDEDFRCINCGRSPRPEVLKASARTQTTGKEAPPKAITAPIPVPMPIRERPPAPAELKRTVPYRASNSILSSNGHWYKPGQISFRREHMIFLINSLPLLQEGHYPRNPIGTGYVDNRIPVRRGRHTAYFETPVALAAEVEARLELCGQDGLILEAVYLWGKTPRYLCQAFNLSEYKLMKHINSALAYISGWRRKQRSYKNFRTHKGAGA